MLLFSRQIDEPMPMIGKLPSPPEGATWAAAAKVIRHVGYKEDGTPIGSGESYTQLFVINVSGGAPRQITSKKPITVRHNGRRMESQLFLLRILKHPQP